MKKIFLIFIIGFAIALISGAFYFGQTKKKLAYIDTIELVNKFDMSVKMNKEASLELFPIKEQLDSLETLAKLMSNKKQNIAEVSNLYMQLREQYVQLKEEMDVKINSVVWKRLNAIISKFGKEKKLDYLYGANGTGSLLYANEKNNYTQELIIYANKEIKNGD